MTADHSTYQQGLLDTNIGRICAAVISAGRKPAAGWPT